MLNRFLVLTLALALNLSVLSQADLLTVAQARNRVETAARQLIPTTSRQLDLLHEYSAAEDGVRVMIFGDTTTSSSVITHNVPSLPPVIGYSNTSPWGNEAPPPALNDWLAEMAEHLLLASRMKIEPIMQDAVESVNNAVTPLLSSNWDQVCLYNDACPIDAGAPPNLCGHVWVGCVATAMGQVMKYYGHPIQGSGAKSYFSIMYGNQSVNFSNATYNWTQMPDILNQPSSEVAELLYHCGVSVEMNYNLLGSGAQVSTAGNAMKTYFGYDSGLTYTLASSYTPTAWSMLLKQELDSARPVVYRSEQSGGGAGHAWVVDGYDAAGLFHCNWGWSGYYDGYYALTNLAPNLNTFNQNHGALIDIRPATPQLMARFTAQETILGVGESMNMTDLSQGNPLSWAWQFPGANIASSSVQHPQNILYSTPGHYDVTLIVGNGLVFDTLVKQAYIIVTPIAEFTADPRVIEAGQQVSFTDLSQSKYPITNWQWTFQGGTPAGSNQQVPPNVTYNLPGTYKVQLSVTSAGSTNSLERTAYIKVYTGCDTLFFHNGKTYSVDPSIASAFTYLPQDLDGLTPYFAGPPYNHTSGWNTFNDGNLNPNDTNYFQGAASFFSPPGAANNWLSFGPFPVSQDGLEFSWKHYYFANNKRDGYEVLWSVSGAGNQHFSNPPFIVYGDNDPASDGDTLWQTNSLHIPHSLAGTQGIWVAFHHFANNQFYLFLDDICITSCFGMPVALSEVPGPSRLNVSPNPASNMLTVARGDAALHEEIPLLFYAIDGRLVLKTSLPAGQRSVAIATEGLPEGLYLMHAAKSGKTATQKIIIRH